VGNQADNQLYQTPVTSSVVSSNYWTVSLAVTNYGPSFSTNVFVSDMLPAAGVSLNSYLPTAGSVQVIGDKLTWTIGDLAINTGAALTLNFYASSPGAYTNEARVYAAVNDPNPDDDASGAVLLVSGVVTPPQLTPVYGTGPNGFQFSVSGSTGNAVVEASTNLVNWIPIYTNLIPFTFTNTDSTNFPMRFYRVVQ
jgi:uncharacterized repeat protein (TIGR01451 family)